MSYTSAPLTTEPRATSPSAFARLLGAYRVRADLSANELARAIGVDPSYVSRLERGDRNPPSRRVALALAGALALDGPATDRLLASAGYLPDDWAARLERVERVEALLAELAALSRGLAVVTGAPMP